MVTNFRRIEKYWLIVQEGTCKNYVRQMAPTKMRFYVSSRVGFPLDGVHWFHSNADSWHSAQNRFLINILPPRTSAFNVIEQVIDTNRLEQVDS